MASAERRSTGLFTIVIEYFSPVRASCQCTSVIYDGHICGENGLGSVRIPMATLTPRPDACGSVSACRSYGFCVNV